MKTIITQDRHILGRKAKTYSAKLGTLGADTGWMVTGCASRDEAASLLFDRVKAQEEYNHARKYVRKGNVTFALFYANGWQYDIVRDDGQASSCHMNIVDVRTYAQALERMLKHVATHDGF